MSEQDQNSELELRQSMRAQLEREQETKARIYVASLSDYNSGRLHGKWVEANQEVDALQAEIQEMLLRSPEPTAEEWAIHDFEGFGEWHPHESESITTVSAVAQGIAENGLAFAGWASRCNASEANELAKFDEAYRGDWQSIEAYADELLDDVGARASLEAVPEWLQPYVSLDVGAFARDLELSGDITAIEHANGVWIFDGTI
ncbi:MAG: antirestriction protein ArdA [Actinomycetota bacterium]